MNRTNLFHIILFVLFSFSILSIYTCEKDPTSPSGTSLINNAVIGPDGGKLETNDFLLQVPAGSFSDDVTLNLSISTEMSGFGENSISETFILKGLPSEFAKPLRVGIQYQGTLSDESYIGFGTLNYNMINGDSSVVYYFESAIDSSGYLVGYLQSENINFSNRTSRMKKPRIELDESDILFGAWTGMETQLTTNFKIHYPSTLGAYIQVLESILKSAATPIINLGFNVSENPKK